MLVALVVPTALIHVGLCFRIIAGEQAIEFLGVAIVLINQRGRVRIVCHVVMKVAVAFQQMADDRAQEYDIASHNQNSIAIHEILRKRGGATAPQRGTQTGYSGAVSYTGLVLD